jgi:transcriptional regulator with XRE-family HTH domain
MTATFGARLRTQREEKGVSLDEISRQTKIKVSLLDALERNNLTYWPHGLFGRAYIRSYGEVIGLEPEPLLAEFLQVHPDPPQELPTAAPQTGFSSAIRSAVGAIPALLRRGERVERTEPVAGAPAALSPDRAIASASVETRELPMRRGEEPAAPPRAEIPAAETIAPVSDRSSATPQIAALADLCTRIQQADHPRQLLPVLGEVAQMIEAKGLVLWLWDSTTAGLKPWLSHGYSSQLVAQLPCVRRDDDNAIAASFRTADTCIVDKGFGETGAIVVPLIGNSRCLGALALELRDGGERRPFVRDAAVVVATLLVPFADGAPLRAAATA